MVSSGIVCGALAVMLHDLYRVLLHLAYGLNGCTVWSMLPRRLLESVAETWGSRWLFSNSVVNRLQLSVCPYLCIRLA